MVGIGSSLEEPLAMEWIICSSWCTGRGRVASRSLGAVVGAFIGSMVVSSDIDQLPHGAMLGATIGTFAGGLAGLAWGPCS
jgi:uncharacterized protein (DUF2062 family)